MIRLNLDHFYNWLTDQDCEPEGSPIVGYPGSAADCPIARFVRTEMGFTEVEIYSQYGEADGDLIPLAPWAKEFVRRADMFGQSIDASDALCLLDRMATNVYPS